MCINLCHLNFSPQEKREFLFGKFIPTAVIFQTCQSVPMLIMPTLVDYFYPIGSSLRLESFASLSYLQTAATH